MKQLRQVKSPRKRLNVAGDGKPREEERRDEAERLRRDEEKRRQSAEIRQQRREAGAQERREDSETGHEQRLQAASERGIEAAERLLNPLREEAKRLENSRWLPVHIDDWTQRPIFMRAESWRDSKSHTLSSEPTGNCSIYSQECRNAGKASRVAQGNGQSPASSRAARRPRTPRDRRCGRDH